MTTQDYLIVVKKNDLYDQFPEVTICHLEKLEEVYSELTNKYPPPGHTVKFISADANPVESLEGELGYEVALVLSRMTDKGYPSIARYSRGLKVVNDKLDRVKIEEVKDAPIRDCIHGFGLNMFICAGELNTHVYTRNLLDTILKEAVLNYEIQTRHGRKEPPFYMTVVCGPVVLIDKKSIKDGFRRSGSLIQDLLGAPGIKVFASKYRQEKHFRMCKYAIYHEDPHLPHEIERVAYTVQNDIDELNKFRKLRADIILSKDVQELKAGDDLDEHFLFLTLDEMEQLSNKLEDRINQIDKAGLIKELKEIGIEYTPEI